MWVIHICIESLLFMYAHCMYLLPPLLLLHKGFVRVQSFLYKFNRRRLCTCKPAAPRRTLSLKAHQPAAPQRIVSAAPLLQPTERNTVVAHQGATIDVTCASLTSS